MPNWNYPASKSDISSLYEIFFNKDIDHKYLDEIHRKALPPRKLFEIFSQSESFRQRINGSSQEYSIVGRGNAVNGQNVQKKPLDAAVTPDIIEDIFQEILKRPTNSPEYCDIRTKMGGSIRAYIAEIRNSDELRIRVQEEARLHDLARTDLFRSPNNYRVPRQLRVTRFDERKILAVGSNWLHWWTNYLRTEIPGLNCDMHLLREALPDAPPAPIADYQFQVVQLPLRSVLFDLALARLPQSDEAGHKALFEQCSGRIAELLAEAMKWNVQHGLLTFILPFPVPQQNAFGRFQPRYSLSNPVYFIERLNEEVEKHLGKYDQAHLVDFDAIAASVGKRLSYEDPIQAINHGFLNDFDHQFDQERIEKSLPATSLYTHDAVSTFRVVWDELDAMYRIARQIDQVKMVVVDLDDTLWRGSIGKAGGDGLPTSEGWPRGLWEALLILKQRGVLLAIISKNEEAHVVEAWPRIMGDDTLILDDFAIRRINLLPTLENMAAIVSLVDILPENILFIDDDPVHRADIKAAFPDIRVLGGTPITWRHILLWSAETQTSGFMA